MYFCQASGGPRVFAARGKRLCCRLHPTIRSPLLFLWSYGYDDGIGCEQYAKLGCKISEFHIFAPPNAAPCIVPPGADAPLAPPVPAAHCAKLAVCLYTCMVC